MTCTDTQPAVPQRIGTQPRIPSFHSKDHLQKRKKRKAVDPSHNLHHRHNPPGGICNTSCLVSVCSNIFMYIYNICIYIYQWHYLHCMKSTGRTEKSVSDRSSMCVRERSKSRGCATIGLLEMQDKRQECKDSAHRRGSSSLLQPKNTLTPPSSSLHGTVALLHRKKKENSCGLSEVPPGSSRIPHRHAKLASQQSRKCVVSTETSQCQSLARAPGFPFLPMALPIEAV